MGICQRRTIASNQDCLVYKNWLGNWQLSLTQAEVSVGYYGFNRYAQGAGLYFPNIQVPQGAEITKAWLVLRASKTRSATDVFSFITIQDDLSPIPFSTLADYQARPHFWKLINWTVGSKAWVQDTLYNSPDISPLIQHIIGDPAWVPGNPMVIFWDDHDNRSGQGVRFNRVAYSYDDKPEQSPILEITYAQPPPLEPEIRKYHASREIQYIYTPTGYTIVLETDVPCHLFLRWSTSKPWIHDKPVLRRGLFMHGDRYFCFVTYEDNEQEEAGDTTVHTFLKPNWPPCETRYFYFIGTLWGDESPSTTAIFELHRPFPLPPPDLILLFLDEYSIVPDPPALVLAFLEQWW